MVRTITGIDNVDVHDTIRMHRPMTIQHAKNSYIHRMKEWKWGLAGACKESLSLLFFSLGNEALSNQDWGAGAAFEAHLQARVER